MPENLKRSRHQSGKAAFCGLMVALSIVLMLSGGLIPIATYCTPMFSAILLLPVLIEYGRKSAWTAFAAVSLITILLGIDKEAAFFYVFLGYYPILKWDMDRIRYTPLRLLLKLAFYNGSILIMYVTLGLFLNMDAVLAEFKEMSALFLVLFVLMLNACMLLYDRLLIPMVFIYVKKVRPMFRFLRR